MSLYSACLFPIVGRGILKVLLSDSVWLVVCHLLWIMYHCYVKYFVISSVTFIVNLYDIFCFLVCVVFLNCTQVFFSPLWVVNITSIVSSIWLID